jgi:hypothetical protein
VVDETAFDQPTRDSARIQLARVIDIAKALAALKAANRQTSDLYSSSASIGGIVEAA